MKKLIAISFIVFSFTFFTGGRVIAQTAITDSLIKDYCKAHHLVPAKSASGLYYVILEAGSGEPVTDNQAVSVNYTGSFLNGEEFDSNIKKKFKHKTPFTYTAGAGQVVKGFDEGNKLLHVGGSAVIIIPPSLGYGDKKVGPIPANSVLVFEVHVLGVN